MEFLAGSFIVSIVLTIVSWLLGFTTAAIIFGVLSVLLLVICIAVIAKQDRDQAAAADRELLRTQNPLRPNIAWWSPEPVPAGAAIKVHVTGSYQHTGSEYYYSGWYIDGCSRFRPDDPPGKYKQHEKLFFDNLPDPAVPFRSAQHFHLYDFLYYGTGERLMLLLKTPKAVRDTDGLSVSLLPLDASDRLLAGLDQPADEEELAEDLEPEEVDPFPEFERRAYLLSYKYANAVYADDTWLTEYARREDAQLLKRKDEIIAEYVKFHRDQAFIAHLQEHHPDVYTRATWEARALFLAEEFTVDPPSQKPPSPDEWRERDLRRRDVASEDFMARAEQRLTREREFEARLREKFPHLTDEQVNTEITKYRQEILSKEDDYGKSTNGQAYRQV